MQPGAPSWGVFVMNLDQKAKARWIPRWWRGARWEATELDSGSLDPSVPGPPRFSGGLDRYGGLARGARTQAHAASFRSRLRMGAGILARRRAQLAGASRTGTTAFSLSLAGRSRRGPLAGAPLGGGLVESESAGGAAQPPGGVDGPARDWSGDRLQSRRLGYAMGAWGLSLRAAAPVHWGSNPNQGSVGP